MEELAKKVRPGEEYIIREARVEDIPSVMLVNMRSLPENYWYGFFLAILNEWNDLFLVVEHKGEIVGYSMSRIEHTVDPVLGGVYNEIENKPLGLYDKLKLKLLEKPFRVAHLISIAVLEEHRGRGLGSRLLARTIRVARDRYHADSIYLEVRVSNAKAIKLYEKFGFRKARIIREYYRDGEDAFVMVLRLKENGEGQAS